MLMQAMFYIVLGYVSGSVMFGYVVPRCCVALMCEASAVMEIRVQPMPSFMEVPPVGLWCFYVIF